MCQCENLLWQKLCSKFGVKFTPDILSDEELLAKFQSVVPNVKKIHTCCFGV
ncbi:3-octaprenyl-4-hydroxybenzoate carboxy-lyase [Campylobacter concisus]|uniref:3-octaprenyl-4-hydroxybenzoate carboxy-lyase n=1 Tax=Campylobacter concisus TaxID=199 RepID=UPI000CD891FB|nr:3-octaprenyl-4-hydroxybenzoate carboxy-lyase [Campylobacter concisus]